jgi:hypothetical protein
MRRQILQRLGMVLVALLAWSGVASAQSWLPAPKGPFNAGGPGCLVNIQAAGN